jgi:hypothetical protein
VRAGQRLQFPAPRPVALTPEDRERMRGLGYIQPARVKEDRERR